MKREYGIERTLSAMFLLPFIKGFYKASKYKLLFHFVTHSHHHQWALAVQVRFDMRLHFTSDRMTALDHSCQHLSSAFPTWNTYMTVAPSQVRCFFVSLFAGFCRLGNQGKFGETTALLNAPIERLVSGYLEIQYVQFNRRSAIQWASQGEVVYCQLRI